MKTLYSNGSSTFYSRNKILLTRYSNYYNKFIFGLINSNSLTFNITYNDVYFIDRSPLDNIIVDYTITSNTNFSTNFSINSSGYFNIQL